MAKYIIIIAITTGSIDGLGNIPRNSKRLIVHSVRYKIYIIDLFEDLYILFNISPHIYIYIYTYIYIYIYIIIIISERFLCEKKTKNKKQKKNESLRLKDALMFFSY